MLQCHGNKINPVWFLFSVVGWLKGLRLWVRVMQLDITSGQRGLHHSAREGRGDTNIILLKWDLAQGEILANPAAGRAKAAAQVEAAAFPSAVATAGLEVQPGPGESSTLRAAPSALCSWSLCLPSGNTFPPALVPRNSLLTPCCFCTALHSPPSCQIPPCSPQWTAQLPWDWFVFTACPQAFQRVLQP